MSGKNSALYRRFLPRRARHISGTGRPCACRNQIISVGGGLPLREENRKLLRELGQVFYLQASAETIYERVKHDTSRPLLQGDDPQTRIRTMLAERDSCYKDAADFVVNVDDKSFEQIMCEIEQAVD